MQNQKTTEARQKSVSTVAIAKIEAELDETVSKTERDKFFELLT